MRHLTRAQIQDIDRRAVAEYGLPSLVLMENAGRGCADLLCRLGISGRVVICCGKGNNAGDGFVIARHLELRGKEVSVLLFADPQELRGDAAANYEILTRTDIPRRIFAQSDCERGALAEALVGANWIVDALLGTGAQGAPRAPLDMVITLLNLCEAHKLAVDLPSGLDCDTGQPSATTFHATHTATFVAPKVGFAAPQAKGYLGLLHVLDIGAPRKLIESALAGGQEL